MVGRGGGGKDDGEEFSGGAGTDADAYSLRVQKVTTYFDAQNTVEIFQVFVRNLSTQPITNVADLDLRLGDAGRLDILADRTFGGSYRGGVFDLAAGGERTVPAQAEVEVLSFFVQNRPNGIAIGDNSLKPIGFSPEGPSGTPFGGTASFRLDVDLIDPYKGGASAEIYMTNTGNRVLQDLDGLAFRFTEKDVKRIEETWGAEFAAKTFYVGPWGEEAPHVSIAPGDRVKLFGFNFTTSDDAGHLIDPDDFKLASDFGDLLS